MARALHGRATLVARGGSPAADEETTLKGGSAFARVSLRARDGASARARIAKSCGAENTGVRKQRKTAGQPTEEGRKGGEHILLYQLKEEKPVKKGRKAGHLLVKSRKGCGLW